MLTQAQVDSVKALLDEGLNCNAIARKTGIGRTTVQRIRSARPKGPRPLPMKKTRLILTEAEYARIRRDAIAAMEQKLARKRLRLAGAHA